MQRRRTLKAELDRLREELDVLRAENARLRLKRQVPPSASEIFDDAALPAEIKAAGQGGGDTSAAMLAEAHVIRASVQTVLHELLTALGQLQRQLETGTPPSELDRRVRGRRASDVAPQQLDATAVQPSQNGSPFTALREFDSSHDAGFRTRRNGAEAGSVNGG